MTDDDPICFAQVPQDLGGDELVARLVGQVINGGPGDHCRVEISLSQVARRDSGYRSPDCRTAGLGDVNDPESAPLSAAHHPPHRGNVSDHAKSNVNRRDQMHRGLSVTERNHLSPPRLGGKRLVKIEGGCANEVCVLGDR